MSPFILLSFLLGAALGTRFRVLVLFPVIGAVVVIASATAFAGGNDLSTVAIDAALAVNTVGMWPEPITRLREIGRSLRPGGRIALVSQPRCQGATAATSAAAGDRLAAQLSAAGFTVVRVETLDLDPPAVCVLATQPDGE